MAAHHCFSAHRCDSEEITLRLFYKEMQESFSQPVALRRGRLFRLSTHAASAGQLLNGLSRAHGVLTVVAFAGLCSGGSPEWDGLFGSPEWDGLFGSPEWDGLF